MKTAVQTHTTRKVKFEDLSPIPSVSVSGESRKRRKVGTKF